jgi:hypothetical protein
MMYDHGVLPKVDRRHQSLDPIDRGRGEIKIVKVKDFDYSALLEIEDDQRMLVPISEHGEHSVISKGLGGTIGDRKIVKQFNKFTTLYDLRLEEQKD